MRPAADVEPTVGLARALLRTQAPGWAELELAPASEGWDNVMFRLGDTLALRMPRRASAVASLRAEARWAEEAAWGLSLPVPVPRFLGEPGEGYPYPWQVTQWFEGTVASGLSQEQRDAYAEQLAGFLVGFHRLAPLDAPENTVRGVSPARRAAAWEDALENAPAALRPEWEHSVQVALDAKPWDGPARWIHGDPHAGNLVAIPRGPEVRLSAVVDLSDLTSGDPASDLGIAQAQFSAEGARRFRAAYGRGAFWADAELWDRAEGWRVSFLAMMHDDASDVGAVARRAAGLA